MIAVFLFVGVSFENASFTSNGYLQFSLYSIPISRYTDDISHTYTIQHYFLFSPPVSEYIQQYNSLLLLLALMDYYFIWDL